MNKAGDRDSRLKMRLALARQAIADLADETIAKTPNERLELMRLIERLTVGKPRYKRTKQGIFNE